MKARMPAPVERLEPAKLPYAKVRRAGDFLFTAGLVDLEPPSGSRPFYEMPIKAQTRAIYADLEDLLGKHGSGLEHVLSFLQAFSARDHVAGYVEQRRTHFSGAQPASTGIVVTGLPSPDAVLQIETIAAIPRDELAVQPVAGSNVRAGYSQAVTFGDWVFAAGTMASDGSSAAPFPGALGSGMASKARIDPNFWFGSPVKSQLAYILNDKLAPVLDAAGSAVEDIVVAHVHLLHPAEDYPAFREAWLSAFPKRRPLTVVSPCAGLGSWGGRIEVTPIALKRGSRLAVTDIDAGQRPRAFGEEEPTARRVGDLVFFATHVAADERGVLSSVLPDRRLPHFEAQSEREMGAILDQMAALCEVAGGSLRDLVKTRAYLTDLAALPGALRPWRDRLGSDVAASYVEVKDSAWVPGCDLSVDGVAYIPVRSNR
jgi:enamine deaminase RidA (YjgF/YER057c/UK114 family)